MGAEHLRTVRIERETKGYLICGAFLKVKMQHTRREVLEEKLIKQKTKMRV